MGSSEPIGHLTTEALFRQHADFVARFLTRMGVPSEQLEDALQEVFLVAHRNGGYRPGPAKPTSYLAGIAIHAAAAYRRRLGAARSRHSDAPVEQIASELADPAHALQVRRDLERLQHVLDRLPEDQCTTLLLVEMEGESCVSVAAGLGCPVGTIYWRLHEARKAVQTALRSPEGARRSAQAADVERDRHAQPARSWMMLFGLDGFSRSEPARLLRLAREQPSPSVALEQRLARHQQLVQSAAELPAWAGGYATPAASWTALLGAGPITAGVAASAAMAAAVLLATQEAPRELPRQELHAIAAAQIEHVAEPSLPATTSAEPAPERERSSAAPEREQLATPAQADIAKPHRSIVRDPNGRSPRAAAAADGPREPITSPAEAESIAAPEPQPRTAEDAAPAPQAPLEPADREDAAAENEPARPDEEFAEMQEVARAERLLSDDPQRALAVTRAMQKGFPEGYFREERAYLEVMALHELGRTREMREKAAAFLRAYPAGLYSSRVRKAVGGRGN
jgi:RNA polymerase sigma-70 factor (ECF subfamily)